MRTKQEERKWLDKKGEKGLFESKREALPGYDSDSRSKRKSVEDVTAVFEVRRASFLEADLLKAVCGGFQFIYVQGKSNRYDKHPVKQEQEQYNRAVLHHAICGSKGIYVLLKTVLRADYGIVTKTLTG